MGTTAVAVLLRGVNVGPHNRVAMPAFRGVLEGLGAQDVRTYLQSGNAVVRWDGDPADLGAQTRTALQRDLGLDVAVVVRTGEGLVRAVEDNPFAGEELDLKLFHVGFLSAVPDPALVAALDHDRWLPDRVAVRGDHLYLAYASAVHSSPLSRKGPRLDVEVTARNLRTVLALRELAERAVPG